MKFVKSENNYQQHFFSAGVVELGIIKSFAGIANDMEKFSNFVDPKQHLLHNQKRHTLPQMEDFSQVVG